MALQSFFAGGRCLGSREIPNFRSDPTFGLVTAASWAYFCPRCGDIWARLAVEGSPTTQLAQRPCLEHGDGTLAVSSRWEASETTYQPDWPEEALRWQCHALLERAYKELESAT